MMWQKRYGAASNIHIISYITNRGQRERELRCVRKMHICIPYPLCPVSKRHTFVSPHPQCVKIISVFYSIMRQYMLIGCSSVTNRKSEHQHHKYLSLVLFVITEKYYTPNSNNCEWSHCILCYFVSLTNSFSCW
jgi:hypothetical protein